MKQYLTLAFLLLSNILFCQGPPPAAELDEQGKELLNELITLCDYESKFNHYRDSLVSIYASNNNWGNKKLKNVKQKIKFEEFDQSIFYSIYSGKSDEQIKAEIETVSKMNENELLTDSKFNIFALAFMRRHIVSICESHL